MALLVTYGIKLQIIMGLDKTWKEEKPGLLGFSVYMYLEFLPLRVLMCLGYVEGEVAALSQVYWSNTLEGLVW